MSTRNRNEIFALIMCVVAPMICKIIYMGGGGANVVTAVKQAIMEEELISTFVTLRVARGLAGSLNG